MKICPLCNSTYEDWIDFCFNDGMPLVARGGASSPLPLRGASMPPMPAPKLADEADLPEPGALRPPEPAKGKAGEGDEAPNRPPPAAPPADITGIFTGPILDEDGEAYIREQAQKANLADLVAPQADDAAHDVPEPDPESDESSRATVPLSSSALANIEPAEPPKPKTELAASTVPLKPPTFDEPMAAPIAAAANEVEWPAEPVVAPVAPPPEPEEPEPTKRGGGMGLGLVIGGVAIAAVLGVAVIGIGAVAVGGSTPEPEPEPVAAVEAPLPAPPLAPVAPPVAAPEVPPVDPALEAAPPATPTPVASPPLPTATPVTPTAVTTTATATPVAKPPTPTATATPVSKPPATTTTPSAPAVTDADPWGAPAATTSGVLKIVTDPDGATVYVNDQQRGKTPLTVELTYGVHNIRVVRSGYKAEVRDVNIRSPELSVPFILKAEVVTGAVNVYGPPGYKVFVDGADRGAMPVTVQVSEGVRQFKLVSDADGTSCSLPKEITFRSPGRPETVTLACN